MKKKALVTGCNGFIGYHLSNELHRRGYEVSGIDSCVGNCLELASGIKWTIGDIKTMPLSGTYNIVFHLAALKSLPESFVFPREYIDTNVYGTYALLNAYSKSRFVFASSSAAAENKSVYGITKRSAEHLLNLHSNSVSVRFMNIFGEGQTDLTMAIPAFCHALKHGNPAIINGDGSIQRDFTYVKDLVHELIHIGESRQRGQTETGYGQPIKILDLYTTLARLAKKKENFKLGSARHGDMKKTCSKNVIKEPIYGLQEGLRRTWKYYLTNSEF